METKERTDTTKDKVDKDDNRNIGRKTIEKQISKKEEEKVQQFLSESNPKSSEKDLIYYLSNPNPSVCQKQNGRKEKEDKKLV